MKKVIFGFAVAVAFAGTSYAITANPASNVSADSAATPFTLPYRDSTGAFDMISGAIDTAKLGTDSVTSVKILNATIDSSKMATASIDTNRLATDSVTTAKLINSAVDTAKIAAASIDTSKLLGMPSTPNGSALCAGPSGRIGYCSSTPTNGVCTCNVK